MNDSDDPLEGLEDLPPLAGREAISRAAERRSWRLEALAELEDLGDIYGIDPAMVRLR